jgi:hypothetical protein
VGEIINTVSDALPLNSGGFNRRLGVFGGESTGFAGDVLGQVTKSFYGTRAEADGFTVAKGMTDPIPRSIFNEYALFNFRGMYGGLVGNSPFEQYKDIPNNPLMGGHDAQNVSISKLIEFFEEFYPKIGYKAQDFLYLKHYRKIPVNHLITLRRFPMPVNDNIFDFHVKPAGVNEKEVNLESVDVTQVAGVTAVTYLGETAGNKLDDILKFTYGLNWEEKTSDMEKVQGDSGLTQQPFYNKIGKIGRATADVLKGVTPQQKFRRELLEGDDRLGTTYANFVIGPVNVINKTTVRNVGLKFSNDITLTFDYELKSLNYVNPKIAMIDIISNMLTMTTNNAQFFGGGHRYYGSAGYVTSMFGDMNKLRNGDFSGYMGSVLRDVETGFKDVFGGSTGEFNIQNGAQGLLKVGKTLLGNMLGGFLKDNIGGIGGTQATAAFISAEPTGNWHLTVGNPLNPIVMMGNMYCDNTVMSLGNGLGYDDFPVEVKFQVDVKHGKPRDKGDIENMFNAGRGRVYAAAASTDDILNLKGADIATYGSIKAGKINLQSTQSAASTGDVKTTDISNIGEKGTRAKTSIFTDNDSTYLSNVVSMMVES